MSDDNSDMINVGGQQITLAQLANMDTDQIDEKRFEPFPVGLYAWHVAAAKLTTIERGGKKAPAIVVSSVAEEVHRLAVPRSDAGASLVGNEKQEIFRMVADKPQDWIGYFKAFASDCGFIGSGSLQELLTGFTGTRFIAPIVHRKNPNDDERPYVNLDRDKIQGLAPHVAAIAEAGGGTTAAVGQTPVAAAAPIAPTNAAMPPGQPAG